MLNSLRWTPLVFALVAAGCANPADDKYKATATAPKPVDEAPAASGSADKSPSTPTLAANALPIVAEGSKIDFVGSKVTGSHSGGFKKFSGSAELAADKPEVRKLAVEIAMDSLWSDNEKLTGHLKSGDFFDVAKIPTASFVSTEIKPGGEKGATHTVTGNLTLHGVTKSISFPATIDVKDGGMTLTSEFAINRRDFNINYPGKQNDLIRDEVVIKLDVKAPKKA